MPENFGHFNSHHISATKITKNWYYKLNYKGLTVLTDMQIICYLDIKSQFLANHQVRHHWIKHFSWFLLNKMHIEINTEH